MRYDAFKELNLRDKGYLVVQTFDENDMDQLLYSYTVGFERSGFPEMISFYPSVNNNGHIFREIYLRMKDGSLTPPCGSSLADNLIPVADLFGNSDIKIYITLLTPEITSHAFEHYTEDLPTNTTPVMLVYVPHPSGEFDFNLIPSSLIDYLGIEYQHFIRVLTDYDNEITAEVD